MALLPLWVQSLARKLAKFILGVLLFWLAPTSALIGQNSPPWHIHGDFSWRSLIAFFDNPWIIVGLSCLVLLFAPRLLGARTPSPFSYLVCVMPLYALAFAAFAVTALGQAVTTQFLIISATFFSILAGLLYVFWPVKYSSREKSVRWVSALFTVWLLFVLPWQGWVFSLMSPMQRHRMENAAFGQSLEASKSFVRTCQPFISRYGQLSSLELNGGIASYSAAKNDVDGWSYTLFFDAERGKGNIHIDAPEDTSGFRVDEESFCGTR